MRVTNIMNFVRTFEPRDAEIEAKLYDTARAQLELLREMKLPSTVLLEYDALCDNRYVELFRDNAPANVEIGFWYEVVEPLCTDIGIPYNSPRGYRWDWSIDPGYSMAYDNSTREKLVDRFMKKFREVFGYYPRTIGGWAIDTYTLNYLSKNYEIDAVCICRDQINTDAYTMVGGYFNGMYYPSKNNIFTPASSVDTQVDIPVIRLLSPDPIHNYDGKKYTSRAIDDGVYTLEPACPAGSNPEIVGWFFKTFYDNESLSQAYTQIGQENSFASFDLVTPLRKQMQMLIDKGVEFKKMCDTGAAFKEKFAVTPPSAVTALDNWDSLDCQSVYYSSKNYVANLFRYEKKVFIRAFYLFDDRIEDIYLRKKCETFDCIYENMPLVDTAYQCAGEDGGYGLVLADDARPFRIERLSDSSMAVWFGENKCLTFEEDRVILRGCTARFDVNMKNTEITATSQGIEYEYKGHSYALCVTGGEVSDENGEIIINGEIITLIPR